MVRFEMVGVNAGAVAVAVAMSVAFFSALARSRAAARRNERLEAENEALWAEVVAPDDESDEFDGEWSYRVHLVDDGPDFIEGETFGSAAAAKDAFRRYDGLPEGGDE